MKAHVPAAMAFFRKDDGAAAIEFAIVGNVFLLVLIGTAYISVMLWHAANLDWAVEAGSRVAVINSSATQADISTAVNTYLSSAGMGAATVAYTVTTTGGVKVGQISASRTENFNVPLLDNYSITFHSTADVPLL